MADLQFDLFWNDVYALSSLPFDGTNYTLPVTCTIGSSASLTSDGSTLPVVATMAQLAADGSTVAGTSTQSITPNSFSFSLTLNGTGSATASFSIGQSSLNSSTVALLVDCSFPILVDVSGSSPFLNAEYCAIFTNPVSGDNIAQLPAIVILNTKYQVPAPTQSNVVIGSWSAYPPATYTVQNSTTPPRESSRIGPGKSKRDLVISVPISVSPPGNPPGKPQYLGIVFGVKLPVTSS
jgi:hypothetical protein